jgi:hypothetical protein
MAELMAAVYRGTSGGCGDRGGNVVTFKAPRVAPGLQNAWEAGRSRKGGSQVAHARSMSLITLTALVGCIANPTSPVDRSPRAILAEVGCPVGPVTDEVGTSLCLCDDLDQVGALYAGGSADPTRPAVAVNGSTSLIDAAEIDGSLVTSGDFVSVGELLLRGSFVSGDSAEVIGKAVVSGDMDVARDLIVTGALSVAGLLRVGGSIDLVGDDQVRSSGPPEIAATPPCACDPESFFDVRGAVAAAAQASDNAAVGLPTDLRHIGEAELTLTGGSYYFTSLESVGDLALTIDGDVSIYIDGDWSGVGSERIAITEGSVLSIYVAGDVEQVGNLSIGDPLAPFSFRLYIGGAGTTMVSVGDGAWSGSIYAPETDLDYVGDTVIIGSVFARRLVGTGDLAIGSAPPEGGLECEPPADPSENGGGDGGDSAGDDDGGDGAGDDDGDCDDDDDDDIIG